MISQLAGWKRRGENRRSIDRHGNRCRDCSVGIHRFLLKLQPATIFSRATHNGREGHGDEKRGICAKMIDHPFRTIFQPGNTASPESGFSAEINAVKWDIVSVSLSKSEYFEYIDFFSFSFLLLVKSLNHGMTNFVRELVCRFL